jgi:hypothetical protein
MAKKLRVMYFTIVTLADGVHSNGGGLYARNNICRLASDDGIELFVVAVNDAAQERGTSEFLKGLGVEYQFLATRPAVPSWGVFRRSMSFDFEQLAAGQGHIATEAAAAIKHWGIDCVVVDYLFATLFWRRLLSLPIAKAIVSCNREADFFAERMATNAKSRISLIDRLAHWRLARYERRVYHAFSKVIVIGKPDRPTYLSAEKTSCITPYLDDQQNRWRGESSRELLFVGGIGHHPNRLAVDYLATKIVPRLASRVQDCKLVIVGASTDDVPEAWRHPAIRYLGASNRESVDALFQNCRLLVCPVKNTFGMKFKIAEALSYGMPFLASPESQLCVPYLANQPVISLEDPGLAVDIIERYLRSDADLKCLAAEANRKHQEFISSQKNVWSRTLFGS